jgi:CRISPR-associated endonuclease/helicase Cas3
VNVLFRFQLTLEVSVWLPKVVSMGSEVVQRHDDGGSSHPALRVLWGKSNAAGSVHLLLAHLLDTAAVAELMWDRYLAPALKDKLDSSCDGDGRAVFALLCGLHDVGKASPAFQSKVPALAAEVRAAGLTWPELDGRAQRWHHSLAGAVVLKRVLRGAGWNREAISWVWPLVAGHHGSVPGEERLRPPMRGHAQGLGAWEPVQEQVVRRVVDELAVDSGGLAPMGTPSRAVQLAISGAVIMADWIASDDRQFPGVGDLDQVSMPRARERAENAWNRLGLRGGWCPSDLSLGHDLVGRRFGLPARPAQSDAIELAERMPAPGLLLLEAPMGEGKTEAALAAAEVLAGRFGADGVFVGMPTQATSDPMFTRVRAWLSSVAPGVPVGLLHGKRRFNSEWQSLQGHVRFEGVDEYGLTDGYGLAAQSRAQVIGEIPAEWFLGRKRGLLAPVTVGTIDQLLHAATRTKHVMLRHAGLAGRVVILDEVHAYDVYMSQFLFEALRWLADAGVPVVLLSATLPPDMRRELVGAYLQGASQRRDLDLSTLPAVSGYPSGLAVCLADNEPWSEASASQPWRSPTRVTVDVLDEGSTDGPEIVAEVLREALRAGGCALVVRNTVARAQRTYAALREDFGADTVLLHARLTAGERADRTERVLDFLGRPGPGTPRPRRLVVVATQLAEQSFDVDVDILVTDLAPVDLLLQRVGRLHRHARSDEDRPPPVRGPRVVVTGMARRDDGPPRLPLGSRFVYGDYLLLRTAALVEEAAAAGGWSIPDDVPSLVARGYGSAPLVPASWVDATAAAEEKWDTDKDLRAGRARSFLLAGPEALGRETLEGLHELATADLDDDDKVAAVVRDGDPSVEVVLVCRDRSGAYRTLDGRPMGPNGEAVSDAAVLEEVIAATIRLPARPEITAAALDELRPLAGWDVDPWLRRVRALLLDDELSAMLGGHRLTYDRELGLIDQREEPS